MGAGQVNMETKELQLTPTPTGAAIAYGGTPMVIDLGVGVPINGQWRWSFDRTLRLTGSSPESGRDRLGSYTALLLTYADDDGPMLRLRLKAYQEGATLLVETTTLRDLRSTALEDSFFNTTFNSPIVRLADGLSYLTYTWGLRGSDGTGIGGNFPDAAIASDLGSLPEMLRLADFSSSSSSDIHQTGDKPFAPLIAYDSRERTLVMSPLNHFLISPMRLIETPAGAGVARGLHGSVDFIPTGTTTLTLLVFGQGLAATMMRWGDLMLRHAGKKRGKGQLSTLVKKLGFWNCYGGYYADLFRPTDAATLLELSRYFQESDLPVRYFGLDLWYLFDQVGFARSYRPHPDKYPRGLKAVSQETGLPFLLHMSAFAPDNEYLDSYEFVEDEGSGYPAGPEFYQDRAAEFRDWGAMGIWPDFLRTQLQYSRSLRSRIGAADTWLDGLVQAMVGEGLEVMLCMPTVGHYLASTTHDNVIAVRTSTDYVNHQAGQLELLGRKFEEYRIPNTRNHNLRQNLLLSLLAGALDLAPSYDVFITNKDHPEGFAEPDATLQALARALSAGIVGIGDKVGHIDKEIVAKLAFPDGTLAQPDHPPLPVTATLQSDVMAFYTSTTIGELRWTYLALFNLSEGECAYEIDLKPYFSQGDETFYDYFAGQLMPGPYLVGNLGCDQARYLVVAPQVGGLHPLGFLDKYITLSGRQVKEIVSSEEGVKLTLELPVGRFYTFVVAGAGGLSLEAEGKGIADLAIEHRPGLNYIHFRVDSPQCILLLKAW